MTSGRIKLALVSGCLILVLVLIIQNADRVAIRFFLFGPWNMPLAVLLALTFSMGAVVGAIAMRWWTRRR